MTSLITPILSYGTVGLHVTIVLVIAALIARKSWRRDIIRWIGEHALVLGFFLSLGAVAGSLLYSNVIGYAPCDLCWWQRILLYPDVLIFAAALYKRDRGVFRYIVPAASIAALIALYQTYIQLGGHTSLLPCTAVGGACAKVFVLKLGYITIPTMSLTIAVSLILLAFIHRIYDHHRNS